VVGEREGVELGEGEALLVEKKLIGNGGGETWMKP